MENQVFTLVRMYGGCVDGVDVFTGSKSEVESEKSFEEWTGIAFSEYERRSNEGTGEDDTEILGEDYEGTSIYITDLQVCE